MNRPPRRLVAEPLERREMLAAQVVINEIHYDPDVKTELVEFLELYNAGDALADLAGWRFTDGIDYTFPVGASLAPDRYLVVAQNPAAFQAKFGAAALGPFVGRLSNDGEPVELSDAAGLPRDRVDYQLGFPWPTVGDAPGSSIELINPALDNDLAGSWRASTGGAGQPTPGARNSVFAAGAAPQMRQVEHSPNQPSSGEDVTITVKVTDPDGVAAVTLDYQLVNPGDYINLGDPRYQTAWTTGLVMRDDGTGGDAAAGDDVYTAMLPGSIQQHRRMVRYRINARDSLGLAVTGPYSDDPVPNFAYYVYDGVPDWTGSARPGVAPSVTYSGELLESVATYQLLTTRRHHEDSQFIPNSSRGSGYTGSDYLWQGTLIYDGQVYDHLRFRARGGVWRYSMGKNMWKFDFNRGHYFQARDDYGRRYGTKWDKLNLSALIQQGNFQQRGEQGLFEAAGFRLHNLAGNPAPNTNYVNFRIVGHADENGPTGSQFDDDFQGLYLVVEQLDGRFLDEHDLPDGNFYKMEGGTGELNNQGPTQPTDKSDLNQFLAGGNAAWWEQNLDLDDYYGFRSILMAIHDYDSHAGKNFFYYHNPETDQWQVVNWDLDLTWTTTYNGGGGKGPLNQQVLDPYPQFALAYRNRMREIRDLLFNPEQTGMLLDEVAQFVYTPGQPSLVDADRAMWDYNPILVSSYINSGKAGHGRFYEATAGRTFAAMLEHEKNYVTSRSAWIDANILTDDALVPDTPVVTYTGDPSFPLNHLTFQTSPFVGNGSFAALQWRIAEVTDPTDPGFDPSSRRRYEMEADWQSGELTTFSSTVAVPGDELEEGDIYRVRVRMKDSGGRWSHWSDPVQFVAGAATGPQVDSLRISEIMYNPPLPSQAEIDAGFTENDAFEFVEITNIGGQSVDLAGVRLAEAGLVVFDFAGSGVTSLAPGGHVVVVKNLTAFSERYDTAGMLVAGAWAADHNLSNGGDDVELLDPGGALIHNFDYRDNWYPHTDGQGFSLVVRDPRQVVGLWDDADGWRASGTGGGSPGAADTGFDPGAVEINELATHSDLPDVDWIELRNTTSGPIDIGGWYLSDDELDLAKYEIPAGTMIPGDGFEVFYADTHFGGRFGLSELGETLYLTSGVGGQLGGYREVQAFRAAENGVTFGRHTNSDGDVDFTAMSVATPDLANAPPQVGPVVINEIMYNPPTPTAAEVAAGYASNGEFEYIELLNPGALPVPLFDPAHPDNAWAFLDGIDFVLPAGDDAVTLAPGQFALIVKNQAAFEFRYGAGLNVIGQFAAGSLADGGETVELYKPGPPEAGPVPLVPMIRVEKVQYRDVLPWPPQADGAGSSISRVDPLGYGNEVTNWAPSTSGGTPGAANQWIDGTPPSVPAGLAAVVATASRIDLSWQAAADPQSGIGEYRVYRNGVLLDATAATGHGDTTAVAGVGYAYQVAAVNGEGVEGGRGAPVEVTILGIQSVTTASATQVLVTMTNPLEPTSAQTAANYSIGGASVLTAQLQGDGRTVALSTSTLAQGVNYTLSVTGVVGVAGAELPPGTQAGFIFTTDLQVWLRMDEGGGGTTADSSGHGRDAQLLGATWTTGRIGGGLSFDGSNDYLNTAGVDLNQWLGGTATVAFWIRTTQSGNNTSWQAPGVTGVEQAGGGNDIFWGWIDAGGFIHMSAGNGASASSTSRINDDQWHHVALLRDAATGRVQVYVDGQLGGTAFSEGGVKTTPFSVVGRIDDTGGTPAYFRGQLDELRVYSRELSAGEINLLANVSPPKVEARFVFYNNSAFDGFTAGAGPADDAAIATDKSALLPGQTATAAHYTSFTGGVNGIIVDVDLDGTPALSAADFVFRAGNSDDPASWPAAPAPSSVTVRPGDGQNGTDRVTILWPDGLLANTWVQVTVLASGGVGLAEDDVFYFGSAVGDSGLGNLANVVLIDAADHFAARLLATDFQNPAPINSPVDFNRDRLVNAVDRAVVRNNPRNFLSGLRLFTAPDGPAPAPGGVSSLAATSLPASLDPALADAAWQPGDEDLRSVGTAPRRDLHLQTRTRPSHILPTADESLNARRLRAIATDAALRDPRDILDPPTHLFPRPISRRRR